MSTPVVASEGRGADDAWAGADAGEAAVVGSVSSTTVETASAGGARATSAPASPLGAGASGGGVGGAGAAGARPRVSPPGGQRLPQLPQRQRVAAGPQCCACGTLCRQATRGCPKPAARRSEPASAGP